MTNRRPLSPMQRLKVFEATKGVCHLCEQPIRVGEPWEVEHKIPLALGGADDPSNMAPAHKDCHSEKTPIDVGRIAKAKRAAAKHWGIRKRSTMPGSRDSKWKKRMDGTAVLR